MMRQRIAGAAASLTLAVIVLSVLMPNDDIGWMRDHWDWFNQPMLMIERVGSAINLVHLILFTLLGGAGSAALPGWRIGRAVSGLLLLGSATELIQFFVPGRNPRLSDVFVDVVAGLLGWAIVRGLSR